MLLITVLVWMLAIHAAQSPPATTPDAARGIRPALSRDAFAGTDACRSCHPQHVRNVQATAHWQTSQLAARQSIVAPFGNQSSHVVTSNPDLFYRMEARDDGFFETAVIGSGVAGRERSQRIDMVIGSGKKGQTYLWWRNNELLQLPLSYWNDLKTWAGNPGFSDRTADFTRPIVPRCLDCHTTFVDVTSAAQNQYNRSTALLGVSCEKCHGPAAAHVAARRTNARQAAPAGREVVNPAHLTRDQRVDLCASCHGSQKLGPPFSFLPGDPVKRPALVTDRRMAAGGTAAGMSTLGIDSHGQQATALMNSRCFQSSAMTCETCHDPHVDQRDTVKQSGRCLTCHKVQACGRFARDGQSIATRCVDCHMPLQPSGLIVSTSATGTAQAQLRTHFIAVHDEAR